MWKDRLPISRGKPGQQSSSEMKISSHGILIAHLHSRCMFATSGPDVKDCGILTTAAAQSVRLVVALSEAGGTLSCEVVSFDRFDGAEIRGARIRHRTYSS